MLLLFRSEALCEKRPWHQRQCPVPGPVPGPRARRRECVAKHPRWKMAARASANNARDDLQSKGKKRRVLTPTQKRTARFTQLIHIYFGSILTDISWYFSWYFWIEKKQRSLETRLATVQIRGFGRPRRASAWHRPLCSRLAWPRGAWCRWHRTGDNGCGSTRARAPWDLHGL